MNTLNVFSQKSRLTKGEIDLLDKKIASTFVKPQKDIGWFTKGLFTVILTVSLTIVTIAGLSFLNKNGSDDFTIQVSAQSIITDAITRLQQMREGMNLLNFTYLETDNSPYAYISDVAGKQIVLLTLDLSEQRNIVERREIYPPGTTKQRIDGDGSVITQYFFDRTYFTYGSKNVQYNIMSGVGFGSGWLTKLTQNEEVATYNYEDPVIIQEEMLSYILENFTLSDYKEITIEVDGKQVPAYEISFDYKYNGFTGSNSYAEMDYNTKIYFNKETQLPIRILDTKLSSGTPEVYITDFLEIKYSKLDQDAMDKIFAVDISNLKIQSEMNETVENGYVVLGKTTLFGNLASKNYAEIYIKPILRTNENENIWLEGKRMYDFGIARPTTLSRFLSGKNVEISGLVYLNPYYGKTMLVDSYKINLDK